MSCMGCLHAYRLVQDCDIFSVFLVKSQLITYSATYMAIYLAAHLAT